MDGAPEHLLSGYNYNYNCNCNCDCNYNYNYNCNCNWVGNGDEMDVQKREEERHGPLFLWLEPDRLDDAVRSGRRR
jgi:hypothetical protein